MKFQYVVGGLARHVERSWVEDAGIGDEIVLRREVEEVGVASVSCKQTVFMR